MIFMLIVTNQVIANGYDVMFLFNSVWLAFRLILNDLYVLA